MGRESSDEAFAIVASTNMLALASAVEETRVGLSSMTTTWAVASLYCTIQFHRGHVYAVDYNHRQGSAHACPWHGWWSVPAIELLLVELEKSLENARRGCCAGVRINCRREGYDRWVIPRAVHLYACTYLLVCKLVLTEDGTPVRFSAPVTDIGDYALSVSWDWDTLSP
ncbi:hypothetical protein GUJ93_ZPchr0012g19483 [Zizania palustris]|uniref:Uncharacterized protein n=1 Tax=Zizania palustris TaxID=103762 RepID=A0A8J6BTB7_ZIZPA|nr:hypothetical protein GUJ93_ZPchr0012g19483 [Zizania palustris]